jgi:hypothetical protein
MFADIHYNKITISKLKFRVYNAIVQMGELLDTRKHMNWRSSQVPSLEYNNGNVQCTHVLYPQDFFVELK